MAKRTGRRMWKWVLLTGQLIVVLSALFGAYTGYHFYFAPTGLRDRTSGVTLHRAQLIDMLIGEAVARGK